MPPRDAGSPLLHLADDVLGLLHDHAEADAQVARRAHGVQLPDARGHEDLDLGVRAQHLHGQIRAHAS